MSGKDVSSELFRITTDRMYSALNAFYIWKWLNLAINTNTKGKEYAEKNVSIINRHSDFFRQIIVSVYKSFVADLSIFFDSEKYQESFSLGKLINVISFNVSEDELNNLRTKINEIKREHGVTIKLIIELRDADVAHQEIRIQTRKINYLKAENLFSAVQEILNILSVKYDGSVTSWGRIEEDVNHEMEWIFDNLERGEIVRLREVEEKWRQKPKSLK